MSYSQVSVHRASKDAVTLDRDRVAQEEPLEIAIDAKGVSQPLAVTMRTPGDDANLAVGFLRGEGVVARAKDVTRVESYGDPSPDSGLQNRVRVTVDRDLNFDLERLRRNFYATSSCGVCGKATLDAVMSMGAQPVPSSITLSAERLRRLPARLLDRQAGFARTGGLHAAAGIDRLGEMVGIHEDVGRHNALDKLLGAALLSGTTPPAVLVSGRASFELVQKCAMSGVELLAAIGAPSSLAVSAAKRFDLTLVGFLSDVRYNVYANPERIPEVLNT